jgi:hypothetical protein
MGSALINRHSPDSLRVARQFTPFPCFREACAVGAGFRWGWDEPAPCRASKIDEFSVIEAHLSREFGSDAQRTNALRGRWIRWRSKFGNQPQDVGKQISRDGDLGHLESDVAPMADDLRADLDELLLQTRQ